MRLQPIEQLALDGKVFDDGFDDPVRGRHRREIVEAGGLDAGERVALKERIRSQCPQPITSVGGHLGGDVEEPYAQAGICQVRGNLRTHGSRTQDGGGVERTQHYLEAYVTEH